MSQVKVQRSEFAVKLAEGHKTSQTQKEATIRTRNTQSLRSLLYGRKWSDAMDRIVSNPEETLLQDAMGDLPLHEVCHTGGAPFQIIQRLIHTNKEALQKRGFCGRLPLHYAAYSKPSVNVIKLLLRHHPAAAKELDDDGRLPLHLAVIRNAPKQSIQAIIDAYPEALKSRNKFGSTPIMLARNEHIEDLLYDEMNKPRKLSQKIQTEKKLTQVWSNSRLNPVEKQPQTKYHPNRAKPTKYPPDNKNETNRSLSPKKKKNPPPSKPNFRKGKSLKELQQNTPLERNNSPRSPIEIMCSAPTNEKKVIPAPAKGAGNYGGTGAPIMSSYRAAHLPKGIPSPAKGQGGGNYGRTGAPVMSNYRRSNLPSPSRLTREIQVVAH